MILPCSKNCINTLPFFIFVTRHPALIVRHCIPAAAILLPFAFFFSVLKPDAVAPNAFIYLAYLGAIVLAFGLITLGIGLIKAKNK